MKFITEITKSAKGIQTNRAKILAEATKGKQMAKITSIEDKIRDIELEMLNITDLAPENTYSLKPGGKGYKPDEWVDTLQECKERLFVENQKLQFAKETMQEWFSEPDAISSEKELTV